MLANLPPWGGWSSCRKSFYLGIAWNVQIYTSHLWQPFFPKEGWKRLFFCAETNISCNSPQKGFATQPPIPTPWGWKTGKDDFCAHLIKNVFLKLDSYCNPCGRRLVNMTCLQIWAFHAVLRKIFCYLTPYPLGGGLGKTFFCANLKSFSQLAQIHPMRWGVRKYYFLCRTGHFIELLHRGLQRLLHPYGDFAKPLESPRCFTKPPFVLGLYEFLQSS